MSSLSGITLTMRVRVVIVKYLKYINIYICIRLYLFICVCRRLWSIHLETVRSASPSTGNRLSAGTKMKKINKREITFSTRPCGRGIHMAEVPAIWQTMIRCTSYVAVDLTEAKYWVIYIHFSVSNRVRIVIRTSREDTLSKRKIVRTTGSGRLRFSVASNTSPSTVAVSTTYR